ncbi:WD and tetratricopeptide repeats protein 1 [Anoplophora glabripennis]|uniref:WD and tetratricopeptide repeats protein 1 n=1 Tax=Anoplophora glabripennis TaxID=217634 RepID=UPI00087580D5|nr:WD and tetratricopeptide repeats protein 1 [Anoplophora glabripennis]
MESKLRKWKNKRDILKLLQYRENSAEASKFFKQHSQFTDSLIKRLGLEYELEGHQGCVNCLQWTPDGKHLASGSDDTNVILWDPFRHRQLQVIPTHHIGNIFSVKFLGSNEIATAAGDCRVLVQSIPGAIAKCPPLLECSCHVNRVKRLATSPIEPTLFWSAAEDGLVIQYDLREQHECSRQSQTKVLVDLSNNFGEVKCIAVNPTKPYYIAVGANDCYIRLYDRRMLKTLTLGQTSQGDFQKSSEREPMDPNCVQYYAAGHLAVENASITNFKLAATYISFNTAGSEMLVNMGGEQIYLFDINNTRHINELQIPQFSSGRRRNPVYKCCCHPEGNGFVSKVRSSDFTEENCACYYMRRAYKCYRRKWTGDLYSAARDYLYVTQVWPDQRQAYIGLVKSLIALKWADEAQRWLEHFCSSHSDYANSPQVRCLHESLESLRASNPPKEKESENSEHKERFLRKVDEAEQRRRLDSRDYEVRFLGHCNTTTDIKEANFLGEDGNYICAGSDEGIIFIWERKHASIVTALIGDVSIVNCIQPHPSACFIASSGIDPAVKLWSPMPEDDNINTRVVKDINAVVEANQQRMSMDPFESMLVNMGYRIPGINVEPTFQEVPSCRPC